MNIKEYIASIPGNVRGKDNSYTDILTLLGLSIDPMTRKNEGRDNPPVASVLIDGKEYALADVLTALKGAMAAELPEIGESDEGKVLMVSGGKYVLAAIPSQLPAITGTDDGKVLTADDGAWVAATLPE